MKFPAFSSTVNTLLAPFIITLLLGLSGSDRVLAYPVPYQKNSDYREPLKLLFYTGQVDQEPVCYGAVDSLNGFFILKSCLQMLITSFEEGADAVTVFVDSEIKQTGQALTIKKGELIYLADTATELVFVSGLPEPESDIWSTLENHQKPRPETSLPNMILTEVYTAHSVQKRSEPLFLSDCSSHSCTLSKSLPAGHPVYDRNGHLLCLAQEGTANCLLTRISRQAIAESGLSPNGTVTPSYAVMRFIPDDLNSSGFVSTMIVLNTLFSMMAGCAVTGAICCCCICCCCACMSSAGGAQRRE